MCLVVQRFILVSENELERIYWDNGMLAIDCDGTPILRKK
jgi:hypothetical protein